MPCIHALGPRLRRWGRLLLLPLLLGAVAASLAEAPPALAARSSVRSRAGKRGKAVKSLRRSGARRSQARLPPLRDGNGVATLLGLVKPPAASGAAPVQQAATVDPAKPQPLFASAAQAKQLAPSPVQQSAPSPQVGRKGASRKGAKLLPTDSEILADARAAFVQGERQKSIDLAMSVAEKNSELSGQAWRFIGQAACSVKLHRMATRAYQNLKVEADQRAVADACRHNGLTYRDDQFVLP